MSLEPPRRRAYPLSLAVLIAVVALLRSQLFGRSATAAAGVDSSPTLAPAEAVEERWTYLRQAELFFRRLRRRRLIRILNQVSETNHRVNAVKHLEDQGPDGSRLVKRSDEDGSGGDSHVGRVAPPEFVELLSVEDRIRRLQHLRRIAHARDSAQKSAAKLALLRAPPAARLLVGAADGARTLALGVLAVRTAAALLSSLNQTSLLQDMPGLSSKGYNDPSATLTPSTPLLRVWEVLQPAVDFLWQDLLRSLIRRQFMVRVNDPEIRIPDVSLEDVAGIGPAKAEALEIVECLKAPARFASLGARCPRGLLLTGPPGCGKTLLAKAIAATAAVPFISRSGADFNGRFAGTGTNLVKELFRTARLAAPAVILIDELDYIGRRRGQETGGGLETDRSAALTQLLAEMDGFMPAEGVVVIGTTNRPDILDRALTRPGRFDRKVTVSLPDVQGRLQILRTHAQKLAMEDAGSRKLTGPELSSAKPVDWPSWARRTPGFSGADLAGLVNEAAMAAAREGSHGVGDRHLQAAYSKSLLGVPSGRHRSAAEMELVALHEAGHAVVNEVMRVSLGEKGLLGFHTVAHISIVPTGGTGGVTQFADADEAQRLPESRPVLLAELAVSMGGRAAEELVTGKGQATMGARSDIDEATRMASDMITQGGLSEAIGPRSLTSGTTPSQELLGHVDAEVKQLLVRTLDAARAALAKNRELHAAIAKALLEKETLDAEAFRQIVSQFTINPVSL